MNQPPRAARASDVEAERTESITPSVDSVTLMGGRRELIIRHGADAYRLRVTASNKLILTK
jgi:hemin uptake protein HemP